jgi:NAD(P)-dependent dehydrogenase (short-subunit alcohol dehydrogenase family)
MTTDAETQANRHVRELFVLDGRVALVTGGAGRYGRQIALALAEAGATVIVASRDLTRCEQFVTELQACGHQAHARMLDLTRDDSVRALAQDLRATWGRLDVLFNNAVAVSTGAPDRYSTIEWARTMECNATGLYRACLIFGTMMAEKGAGSIVNIGSIYGVVSPDFRLYEGHEEMASPPSYGFVKAGMVQLTRYLAVYFGGRGVRVNCLSPGGLYSRDMPAQFPARYRARTPLKRMAGINDLKGAALFLAADASAYVTGQNLLVDGGFTLL